MINHVKPGDPFGFKAGEFNAMADAANAHRQPLTSSSPPGGLERLRTPSLVWIKNDSGADLPIYGVVGLDALVVTPSDDLVSFKQPIITFEGVTPATGTHDNRYAITTAPIANGNIGPAVIDGMVQVQVNKQRDADAVAAIKNGDNTQLLAGTVGHARILWSETGTGTKWAVVMLNSPEVFTFDAKITGNAAIPSTTNRWKYAWTEQVRTSTGWANATNARTGTTTTDYAINGFEANNSGAGIQGNGVDIDGAIFTANTDLEVQPIQGNPVVRMVCEVVGGSTYYSFYAPNAIDGECA